MHKLQCVPILKSPDIEDLAQTLASKYDHSCECKKCGSLCSRVPGIYDPTHVLRRAAQDATFFDTCVQDYFIATDDTLHFYLRPAQVGEKPASRAKFVKKFDPCSHLTAAGCALNHRDRPLGCRTASGCGTKPSFDLDPKTASELWHSKDGQQAMLAFEKHALANNNSVGDTHDLHEEMKNISLRDFLSLAEMAAE